jgi:hypothetical protein
LAGVVLQNDFSCFLKQQEGKWFKAHELRLHCRVVSEAAGLSGQMGEMQAEDGIFRDESELAGQETAEQPSEL